MDKKGVSSVIATVLLVLLTIAAVAVVWNFIQPMVEEQLTESKSCYDLKDYCGIQLDGQYTCYGSNYTKLMIKRGIENYEIKGFLVKIIGEGDREPFKVTEDNPNNIKMLNQSGNFITDIKLPEPGGARTYRFNKSLGKRAEIAVIKKGGNTCNSKNYDIPEC